MLKNWSIKNRVTLFIVALFMGCMSVSSIYIIYLARADGEKHFKKDIDETTSFIAQGVDAEIQKRITSVQFVARDIERNGGMKNTAIIQRLLEARPLLLSILFNGGIRIFKKLP